MKAINGRIVQSMKSTVKAFQVLEDLCSYGPSTALDLSQRLGLNRSSVHRILAVLQQMEYVQHEPGGSYEPTLHLYHLGNKVKARLGTSAIIRPRMEALSDKVGATVSLVTLTKDFVITVIDRVFSRSDPRPNIIIDGPFPSYLYGVWKSTAGESVHKGFRRLLRSGPDSSVHLTHRQKHPAASPAP